MINFYICSICGNLIEMVKDSGNSPSCCGKTMTMLKPNTVDGATEKHIPLVTVKDCKKHKTVTVQVGDTLHPMSDTHYIQWVVIETNKGIYRKNFCPSDVPIADFCLEECEELITAYAYCNLHGLWNS